MSFSQRRCPSVLCTCAQLEWFDIPGIFHTPAVQLWPFLKLYIGPFGGKNGFHNQHYKKVIYNEVDEWWYKYVSEHAFLQIKCRCWWTSIILYRTSTFLHSKTPQFLTFSQINNLLEILSLKRCNLLWKHHQGWREQMNRLNSDCQTQKILPQLTNLMIDSDRRSGFVWRLLV